MVQTIKIADFIEAALNKEHDLSADTIQIALSNTAPAAEASNPTATGNGTLANVTEIAYNFYGDSLTVDRVLEGVTSIEAGGTYTFAANDFTITATGGDLPGFRYIYIFNQTSVTPDDSLVGCIDLEEVVTLTAGSSINVNFNVAGVIQIV